MYHVHMYPYFFVKSTQIYFTVNKMPKLNQKVKLSQNSKDVQLKGLSYRQSERLWR